VNEEGWVYLMLISLLICNAYQLLILHKLNEKSTIELQQKKQLKSQKQKEVIVSSTTTNRNSKTNEHKKAKPSK
jgi:hypothetical protein